MTDPPAYGGPPVDLPLDAWLYEAKPKKGCRRCKAEAEKLRDAIAAGDASARFEAARNIRQCTHGAAK